VLQVSFELQDLEVVMTQVNGHHFRPEELISMRRLNRKTGEWSETEYPKVGGRLRIAHEQNDSISITTEIVQYDGQVAVVKAMCSTDKGSYSGIGMSSVERDAKIAPAILELAETRAIARALRFSGVGVEYCSAEEISHLEQDKHSSQPAVNDPFEQKDKAIYCPATPGNMQPVGGGGNGGNGGNGGADKGDNNNGRLSQKQHSFLLHLADDRGVSRKALDEMSKERFACVVSYPDYKKLYAYLPSTRIYSAHQP
jgi:hypothetical protein